MRHLLIILLCAGTALSGQRDQTGFEKRRARLLEVVSQESEQSLFAAAARLALHKDSAMAYSMIDSMTHDRVIGGMFYAYAMIGTYLHTRAMLPDSLHRKVREAFRFRTMYRGDTENHWVMYYTGMYLAAQTWPGEDGSRWFNGRSSQENFREAEEWLTHWMRITTTMGQGEFDSPTYITVFLAPMLVLSEFAREPVMKRKAQMMLDLLFADFAVEHLRGNYGGGHSRDYPDDIINPLAAPATMWAWLYFGEPEFEQWNEARYRPRHRGSWETLFGALGSYRLPEIIRLIATDRATPYAHRERKRVRNIIRFGDTLNPPVYKYTFMTKDVVLGSLHGGILQPIQQHTWDVTFVSDKPNNTIFTLHPSFSARELAMFFPEEQKFLAAEVDRYHLVYTNPGKWNSSSPYEQTFQHRSALIVLYSIPAGEKHPHVDGFFPKTLERHDVEGSGWILCKAGRAFIAFFPLKTYEWIDEGIGWRWRSHDLKNGVVVEVGSSDDFPSFDSFRLAVERTRLSFAGFDDSLTVEYRTTFGDTMRFTYGGERLLNGSVVALDNGMLYDGPFMRSVLGSGVVTLKHDTRTRTLDFNSVTLSEE